MLGLQRIGNTNLYRARVVDSEKRKTLLLSAPKLRQSSEFSNVYINKDLTFIQRNELMDRRKARMGVPRNNRQLGTGANSIPVGSSEVLPSEAVDPQHSAPPRSSPSVGIGLDFEVAQSGRSVSPSSQSVGRVGGSLGVDSSCSGLSQTAGRSFTTRQFVRSAWNGVPSQNFGTGRDSGGAEGLAARSGSGDAGGGPPNVPLNGATGGIPHVVRQSNLTKN